MDQARAPQFLPMSLMPIDLAAIIHPVERNQAINQSYFHIGMALLSHLGEPRLSNWCIFAQFASRQVGEWIRELSVSQQTVLDFLTLPARIGTGALDRAISDVTALPKRFLMFEPLLGFAMHQQGTPHGNWKEFLHEGLWRQAVRPLRGRLTQLIGSLEKTGDMLRRIHQNLVQGNQQIYGDLVPELCRFLDTLDTASRQQRPPEVMTFSHERDPRGFLAAGFAIYRQIYLLAQEGAHDPQREPLRRQLMHQANLLLGCHEQLLILQPVFDQMREELRIMSHTMTLDDPLGSHKLLPAGGDWGDFYQRMGIQSPLPSDSLDAYSGQRILDRLLPVGSPQFAGTIAEYFERGLTDTRLHQQVPDVFQLARSVLPLSPSRLLRPAHQPAETYWDALYHRGRMSQERSLEEIEREKLNELMKIYVSKLARLEKAYAHETGEAHRMQLEYQLEQARADRARIASQLAAFSCCSEGVATVTVLTSRPRLTSPPSRPSLHKYVACVLSSDTELGQFCWQYYPRVHAEFASGQTYPERLLLLLRREADDAEALLDSLFAFSAERSLKAWHLLTEES